MKETGTLHYIIQITILKAKTLTLSFLLEIKILFVKFLSYIYYLITEK